MTVVALDTHEVVKELEAAVFTDEQAEAVTPVVRRAQDLDLADLATKQDVQAVKTELQIDLAEAKADLLKWMIGAIGVQTMVILGALVRALPR